MQNTALTFFQRMNKKHYFFSKFYPFYNKEQKNILSHSQDIFTNLRLNKFTNMTKIKTDNISICLTLNLDQFTKFLE